MIEKLDFVSSDDRITKYILPKKILRKQGMVTNEAAILMKQDLQIAISETDCIEFKNEDQSENAAILLDFGTEFSGGIRILTEFCSGSPTPLFQITFGESAGEAISSVGFKNATNDHSVRDMTVRLTMLSDMEFGQTGFRFVQLKLLEKNTKVRIKSVLGAFTYRDIEYKGSFLSNDARLNEIYNVCAYTCHLNMQNMLWDGIKRDRLVWIGDMHPEMLTIRTVFGADRCIEQGLNHSMKQYPLPGYPNGMVTYAMWWIIIAYDWYFYTGNNAFITKARQYILGLLRLLCQYVNEDGTDTLGDIENGYFLDWPTLGTKEAISGVRALFGAALHKGSMLCDILGETVLSNLCREKEKALANFVPSEYYSKAPAAMMVLSGQLDAQKAAKEVLLTNNSVGMSTFLSYYILSALAEADRTDAALNILKEYYGGMLDAGATTFWEDFQPEWIKEGFSLDHIPANGEYDIHGDNGAFCYKGYRHSLCHGWSSAPTAFLAERVLGIQIMSAGCKKIRISPNLGELQWAKGTYPTPFGIITVSHVKQTDGSIKTDFSLPPEIELVK